MKIDIPDQSKVISRYGADAQAMVHMEECAELIQAASKMRRVTNAGKDDTAARFNLVEEMADVLNLIYQMEYLLQGHNLTGFWLEQKLNRTLKRIEEGQYDK